MQSLYEPPSNAEDYLELIDKYVKHLHTCVAIGILQLVKLPESILNLEGMSSHGIRTLLNVLCRVSKGHYLEIGSWKGSTFISALYNNKNIHGTSIDFHQEFEPNHPFACTPDLLRTICEKHLTNGEKYTLLSEDSFKIELPKQPVDIYLYDGIHTYEGQYKALTYYYDCLQPFFYFICDDYSTLEVEKATQQAMKDLDIEVVSEFKLFGNQTLPDHMTKGFWNGYYVAFCIKRKEFPQCFNGTKPFHRFA